MWANEGLDKLADASPSHDVVQPVVDLGQACARADPRAPVRADGDGVEAAQVRGPDPPSTTGPRSSGRRRGVRRACHCAARRRTRRRVEAGCVAIILIS